VCVCVCVLDRLGRHDERANNGSSDGIVDCEPADRRCRDVDAAVGGRAGRRGASGATVRPSVRHLIAAVDVGRRQASHARPHLSGLAPPRAAAADILFTSHARRRCCRATRDFSSLLRSSPVPSRPARSDRNPVTNS